MKPFEELYGWSCNTPINWSDQMNRLLIGLDMLAEMEKEMQVIKNNLKVEHDKQNNYANQHRAFKEFQVGEHLYLCIKTRKSSLRIGSFAKLAPQYCRPFNILESIVPVDYILALPLTVKVHDVFHVSLLKRYVKKC